MASQSQEETLEILYADRDILVCIKPARVLSTDEPVVCLLWSEKHWGKKRQTSELFIAWTGLSAV